MPKSSAGAESCDMAVFPVSRHATPPLPNGAKFERVALLRLATPPIPLPQPQQSLAWLETVSGMAISLKKLIM